MTIDSAGKAFLGSLKDQGIKPFHQMSVTEAREVMGGLRKLLGPGPEMRSVKDVPLGANTPAKLRVLTPGDAIDGVIIYCHGGGWTVMDIDDYDSLGRLIALETNCSVVLVDYRKAPENPFPAALDDVWAALQWATTEYASRNSEMPVLIAGDSSGGNLAAVVAQMATSEKTLAITQQILIYPVTQPDLEGPCYLSAENQGFLGKQDMAWFWDNYCPNPQDRLKPEASPLLAEEFAGLPPAVLITAEHDVLRDEGEAYAHKLKEAGVEVVHQRFAGQMHGFFSLFSLFPESTRARAFVVNAIRNHLRGLPSKHSG
ncbi:alpha/beta hydrolase [Salinisphaera orenii]|uniref:alpha/beta hydrolase n=1 Tax=Salinisphaera orenii TaxID=856731 RepID=UPI000F4C7544|nr:alpha/beta hydrolase [Salinisphaera orenii]